MMKNALRPYGEYRETYFDWLDEIPIGWELTKLSTKFFERRTKVSDKDYMPLSVTKKGVVPQLSTAAKSNDGDNRKLVKKGDFVINSRSDRKGSSGLSPLDGSVSLINIVLEPQDINPEYAHYLFKSNSFIEEYYRNGRGIVADLWTTRFTEMKNIYIPIPSDEEQDQIVKFLDFKLVKINKFIKAKKKLIAVLKEQKQAIINQAVSKGLDPDVKMKPSGIEWLGDVPEHWEVHAIKRLLSTKMTDGPHETPEFTDSGIPFVSADAVKDGRILFERMRGYISEETHQKYTIKVKPQKNDIFIVKSGSTTGKACIVDFDEEFSIWSPLALVRTNTLNDPYYVYYSICSSYFKKQVENKWSFGTQPNIGMGILQNLFIAVPSLDEQLKIADIVKSKTVKVDAIIKRITSELDYINEYKNSIISNVVTGKVDVRNVIIDESENDIEEIFDLEDENEEVDDFIDEGGDE